MASAAADGPRASSFRAVARADAGLFTHRLDYPVAAQLAAVADHARVRPSVLTLGNLLLGVGTSVAVIAVAPWLDRTAVHVIVGVCGWLIWQVA